VYYYYRASMLTTTIQFEDSTNLSCKILTSLVQMIALTMA
jgi:hypothetical protein